jgi:hypothetical protein
LFFLKPKTLQKKLNLRTELADKVSGIFALCRRDYVAFGFSKGLFNRQVESKRFERQ